MFNYAVRLALPYADVSGIIALWSDRSTQCVAFQHDADTTVKKTHVHLVLINVDVKEEALKRMWKDCPGKGNQFWSWKTKYRKDDQELPVDIGFVTYMSKGKLSPVFVKNISQDILDGLRQAWVESSLENDKSPADHTERIIQKVLKKFDSQTFKTQYHIRDMDDDYTGIGVILQKVRTEAFRQLWGEHRRAPHASYYKMVAGSAFLRLCERLDRLDEGMIALQDLWY